MTSTSRAAQLLVSGIVQMVGYRAWTTRTSRALGLTGFVRNLDDGRVEIFAEGDERALDALVTKCWQGPPGARVDDVVCVARPPRGAVTFVQVDDAARPE